MRKSRVICVYTVSQQVASNSTDFSSAPALVLPLPIVQTLTSISDNSSDYGVCPSPESDHGGRSSEAEDLAKRLFREIPARSTWSDTNHPSYRSGGVILAWRKLAHRISLNDSCVIFIIFTSFFQSSLLAEATVALDFIAYEMRSDSFIVSWYTRWAILHSDIHYAALFPLFLFGRLPTAFNTLSKVQYMP